MNIMISVSFSIIVTVYNAEQYLRKCIDSILSQKYEKFELIAVDDGSTDSSGKILDVYASSYSRISVIHKENGGIGTGLQAGVLAAKNEYILFVDSDDYIEKDMCRTLADCIIAHDRPDAIQFGLIFEDNDGEVLRKEKYHNYYLDGTQIIKDHFENCPSPSLACRIFKRDLYENVKFLKQNIGIDEILIIQLLSKANTFVSIDRCFYHVYVRDGSVSRQMFHGRLIKQYRKVYHLLLTEYQDAYPTINYIRLKYIELLRLMFVESKEKDRFYLWCLKEFMANYRLVKTQDEYKKKGVKYLMGMMLFSCFPQIYKRVRRLTIK